MNVPLPEGALDMELTDLKIRQVKPREKPYKDLSPETDCGKLLTWMRQHADRLDPHIESPKSILDRKSEILRRW
jgi:hypothetical protein